MNISSDEDHPAYVHAAVDAFLLSLPKPERNAKEKQNNVAGSSERRVHAAGFVNTTAAGGRAA